MAETIVAGNWKMHTTVKEAVALVSAMKPGLETIQGVRKVVCPPFVSLATVHDLLAQSDIGLGAQNMHYEDQGAYTGEVSPAMLADLCEFVIVGHSERRQYFGETDETVNLKVKAALRHGLRPILCVGERLDEREEGKAGQVVTTQLRRALDGVEDSAGLVVAYEPVWAIGTGRAATPETAQEMMALIRSILGEVYGPEAAAGVSLLYGGSVNPDNIAGFMAQRDVDGALVGGASLKADSFVDIVRQASLARG